MLWIKKVTYIDYSTHPSMNMKVRTVNDLAHDIKKRKLTKREALIYDYIQPRYRKQFVKLTPYQRKRLVDNVIRKLEKRNYDISEFKETTKNPNSGKKAHGRYISKVVRKATSQPNHSETKGNANSTRDIVRSRYISKIARKSLSKPMILPVKTAYIAGKKIKEQKRKEVLLDESGSITRKKTAKEEFVTGSENKSKEEKKREKQQSRANQKKGKNVRHAVGRQMDKALSTMATYDQKKSRSIDEIQKEWRERTTSYGTKKAGKVLYKSVKKTTMAIGKLIVKLVTAVVGALMSVLAPLFPFLILLVILIVLFTTLFGAVALEEERQSEAVGSYQVSESVLQYKEKILEELKKYGKEEYIDLFLAVVMQESGGNGNDIFQCSESLGKETETISVEESIEQGVKVLCGHMDHEKVKVASVNDLEHIKVALQAYNYGGGYIDYINNTNLGRSATQEQIENIGKWTQENALAYQCEHSKVNGYPVPRTGTAAEILGPYAYGDAYYTEHVLRYYVVENSGTVDEVKGMALNERINYLFPNGIPTDEATARSYMQTISVKIYTIHGKESTMNITVHKKLVNAYKQAFDGMCEIKFPVDPGTTAAYCWRNMSSDSGKQSYHSYGSCIDINWNSNPATYTGGLYRPFSDPLSITPDVVKIWADAGFYWGGNWTGYYRDYMHFTYTDN